MEEVIARKMDLFSIPNVGPDIALPVAVSADHKIIIAKLWEWMKVLIFPVVKE